METGNKLYDAILKVYRPELTVRAGAIKKMTLTENSAPSIEELFNYLYADDRAVKLRADDLDAFGPDLLNRKRTKVVFDAKVRYVSEDKDPWFNESCRAAWFIDHSYADELAGKEYVVRIKVSPKKLMARMHETFTNNTMTPEELKKADEAIGDSPYNHIIPTVYITYISDIKSDMRQAIISRRGDPYQNAIPAIKEANKKIRTLYECVDKISLVHKVYADLVAHYLQFNGPFAARHYAYENPLVPGEWIPFDPNATHANNLTKEE